MAVVRDAPQFIGHTAHVTCTIHVALLTVYYTTTDSLIELLESVFNRPEGEQGSVLKRVLRAGLVVGQCPVVVL